MTVVNKSFLTILIFFCQILFPLNASALEAPRTVKAWASVLGDNIAETWNEPQHVDLYVLAITWHARFAYDKEKTDRYNERPWGAGMGKSRWDEKGNWHGLYVMAFKDSYNKWEPIAGYGWEATWRPLPDDAFHVGLGYTVGVTARDNWDYIPIPLVLPLASVGYGPATFQMTYIPGTYNNGNVYFAWLRLQF
ncbi:phospholipid:lipid A palmitoyltransferase [Cronobacter sakazakii]|uniref:lipid IV(A) palmitoyltransferase PagP n=1 Tax=Cronobacter sakazakii TaxID=28141 RepID=UPI000F5C6C8B|nr:lipid IV(A) palmitoyltransferase PagP [Cronobacter sakazakii]RRA30604.1 phospholipid:lipid A palmitoyltransferase [Cronobacter sakazakii]RRA34863.1 phospholipid:lipid A palmitoyltransferase [Cronobacter sakazakii]HAU5441501.1 phospholipid:lipid A palmitoyltransferase [Cronobacter sakazakii]